MRSEIWILGFGFWIEARCPMRNQCALQRDELPRANPKSKIQNPKSLYQRAYTLIELLIVVAVLGISGALLVPQLVGRDVMACQAAVRLVIGDLSFAQADALSHQELRRVHFNDDGSGYCITRITQAQLNQAFDPDTADYIVDPLASSAEQGRYIVNFITDDRFENVTITSVDVDGGDDVHYDALGGTLAPSGNPSVGGAIVVSSPSESYEITVAPVTGKLTVRKL